MISKARLEEILEPMGCYIDYDNWFKRDTLARGATWVRVKKEGCDFGEPARDCVIIYEDALIRAVNRGLTPEYFILQIMSARIFEWGKLTAKKELKEFLNG